MNKRNQLEEFIKETILLKSGDKAYWLGQIQKMDEMIIEDVFIKTINLKNELDSYFSNNIVEVAEVEKLARLAYLEEKLILILGQGEL